MRSLFQLPLDIATAIFFSASIGIAAGVVAISFSHRLGDGVLYGLPSFALAAATFGYLIWRSFRPRKARVSRAIVREVTRQVA